MENVKWETSFLSARYDDPQKQVHQQTGDSAGNQGDQEHEPEPERADSKKLSQPSRDACDDPVPAGPAQGRFHIIHHHVSPLFSEQLPIPIYARIEEKSRRPDQESFKSQ